MLFSPRRQKLKALLLIFGLLCATCSAQEVVKEGKLPAVPTPVPPPIVVPPPAPNAVTSLADLKRLSQFDLEQLYSTSGPGSYPVGFVRGQVLLVTGTSFPRLKTRLAGAIWKGKHFSEQGDFINQWIGFRAVHSNVHQGASLFDGRPSLILEYPEKTVYFGKMRDEAREVAPGVYLAMVYERTPPFRFRGFIGLEIEPGTVRGYR